MNKYTKKQKQMANIAAQYRNFRNAKEQWSDFHDVDITDDMVMRSFNPEDRDKVLDEEIYDILHTKDYFSHIERYDRMVDEEDSEAAEFFINCGNN